MKRIISLLLSVILTFSLAPVSYATKGNGERGPNYAGGSQTGSFWDDQQGYRIYIVDANGNRISRVVDMVFSDPNGECKYGVEFYKPHCVNVV